ncbi:MAG TPA: hypothetical protein DCE71_07840 [Parachlamydiales bacterium]|nr:hypothetical protein [Parachlamydiales bacterium]
MIETIVDNIIKNINEGWSLNVSKSKAGCRHTNNKLDFVINHHPRYIEAKEKYMVELSKKRKLCRYQNPRE